MKCFSINLVVVTAFVALAYASLAAGQEEAPHECERVCVPGDVRRCVYNWTLEWYPTRSKACYDCPFVSDDCSRPHCVAGDGFDRVFIATNRQLPGPRVEVCEGDTVVVAVTNHLEDGSATTIHWHGMYQRDTQYMDGGYMVTQCGITHRSTFVYEFQAYPAGTHFWHSHTQIQRGDGLYGPLVIKQAPEIEPHYDLYDHDCDHTPTGDCEYIALISDWFHEAATAHLMRAQHVGGGGEHEIGALLNGKMNRYDVSDEAGNTTRTPYERFSIEAGKRYRFRVTSASNDLVPWKVSVEGHNLTMIAADGMPIIPFEANTFAIYPGESYDFILTADRPAGSYWFKFHGLIAGLGNYALGVMSYVGAESNEPVTDPFIDAEGVFLNPVFITGDTPQEPPRYYHGNGLDYVVSEMTSVYEEDWTDEVVDITYYIGMDFEDNDHDRFNHREYYPLEEMRLLGKSNLRPLLNNITNWLPPSPPLTQPDDFDMGWTCNRESIDLDHCHDQGCSCLHLIQFPLGAVVELVLVNEAAVFMVGSHPLHLHGYSFRLMAMGQLGTSTSVEEVRQMNEAGEIEKKLIGPSYRDTVQVMDGGYSVFRFKADNPGFWYLHCHVEGHVEIGQVAVIQVGEFSDMPAVPPRFPTCGDFNI